MKNNKKSAKQLRHLQAIYNPSKDGGGVSSDSGNTPVSSSAEGVLTMKQDKYTIVRKDLIFLIILIVVIIGILFTLNYLIQTTSFGDWMNRLVGKII
ncbi:hypothetical protein KKE14_00700 [Patescibacteria group bacterium]|nr:hypothetical protein [Patescibacteria group bacterium]